MVESYSCQREKEREREREGEREGERERGRESNIDIYYATDLVCTVYSYIQRVSAAWENYCYIVRGRSLV